MFGKWYAFKKLFVILVYQNIYSTPIMKFLLKSFKDSNVPSSIQDAKKFLTKNKQTDHVKNVY